MTRAKPVVMHIIAGLGNGGAEATLFRLCRHDTSHRHVVISLTDDGKYGPLLRDIGVTVLPLGMMPGKPSPGRLWALWRALRSTRPDIVQTWMYHADLLGGVMARLAGVRRVIWNIRHSGLEATSLKRNTRRIARLCARLSGWVPHAIICCAQEAKCTHAAFGYETARMTVIPNGYDISAFHAPASGGLRLRPPDVPGHVPLIGMVARLDVNKDHRGFLQALGGLRDKAIPFHAVLAGQGMTFETKELADMVRATDLQSMVSAIGPRSDMPAVYRAMDLHVLYSLSEGFPNVVAEAMLCGTPCVVSDVGDAARIVGETGWVVPPSDPAALTAAIEDALAGMQDKTAWAARQDMARNRITQRYAMSSMVEAYAQVWSMAGRENRGGQTQCA